MPEKLTAKIPTQTLEGAKARATMAMPQEIALKIKYFTFREFI